MSLHEFLLSSLGVVSFQPEKKNSEPNKDLQNSSWWRQQNSWNFLQSKHPYSKSHILQFFDQTKQEIKMKGQDPFWTPYGENYITTVLLGFKRDCCLSMTLDKKSEELLLGG